MILKKNNFFGKNPKILVYIVPVYNVAEYLPCCIDSILIQTFTDFELLLIDDGSTDLSGRIYDEYKKRDSHIHVFHQVNGGANSARAFGYRESCGDYVTFVDSDDNLPKNALDILTAYCSVKYDIIIGRAYDEKINKEELTFEKNRSCAISGAVIQHMPWAVL